MNKARKAVRVSVRAHHDIDDWISNDGPLVIIGEAAHPFPVRISPVIKTNFGTDFEA